MAAYNCIEFEAKCPSCNQVAPIHCQTRIASDYGGDETGRFCFREYRLGDKMSWWPYGHKDFAAWRAEWLGSSDNLPLDQAVEACYGKCGNCKADLCAVIRFENLIPTRIEQISLEENWPEGYKK